MKLGISSYSYGWAVGVAGSMPEQPLTALQLLERAEQFGVEVLQIGDNLPLHRLAQEELKALKQRSAAAGIGIEAGTRGFTPEILSQYLELAQYLNSPILRIVPDLGEYEPSVDEIAAIAKRFMPEYERAGVILAVENHDRFLSAELAELVERVGSDCFGICLDTVNSMGAAEGIQQIVHNLAPYTVNLHVKDFTIARHSHLMGFTIDGAPAGRGMLKLDWLLPLLRKHGKTGSAILELWTPPETSLADTIAKEAAWVEQSVAYLKGVFQAEQ